MKKSNKKREILCQNLNCKAPIPKNMTKAYINGHLVCQECYRMKRYKAIVFKGDNRYTEQPPTNMWGEEK